VALGIFCACFGDVKLGGVSPNNLHDSLFLVASIYGIAVDILGLIASEIAYPWL
jgi:hypothetical protein